jgi:superfamily I DNA/RNA helicase
VVRNALVSADVPTLELQARQVDPGRAEPGVRFGSMKRIKGLEFKAVAMIVQSDAMQSKDPADRRKLEHYVAATRARERLLVVRQFLSA